VYSELAVVSVKSVVVFNCGVWVTRAVSRESPQLLVHLFSKPTITRLSSGFVEDYCVI